MKKKIILWILVVSWMGLIFYFSSMDATKSTSQSQGLIESTKIVQHHEKDLSVEEKEAYIESLDRPVRKVAHGGIYFILGILVFLALDCYNMNSKKLLLISILICFLYACSDEFHQLLINGRSGEIRDIIIDSFGAIIGIMIMYLIRRKKYVNNKGLKSK